MNHTSQRMSFESNNHRFVVVMYEQERERKRKYASGKLENLFSR